MTGFWVSVIGLMIFFVVMKTKAIFDTLGRLSSEIHTLKKRMARLEAGATEQVEISHTQEVKPQPIDVPTPIEEKRTQPACKKSSPAKAPLEAYVPPYSSWEKKGASLCMKLLGGNTLAKVGIVLLFIGAAFLLKYAVSQGYFPVWLRYWVTGMMGVSLAVVGLALQRKQSGYAKVLFGGGIGITYLTIFAAFQISALLPVSLALTLLVVLAFTSVAAAFFLDSINLACVSTLGGLLAPVLIGSYDHMIGLFAYYCILNIGTFMLAMKKNWRVLNSISFVFTYAISMLWRVVHYHEVNRVQVEVMLNLLLILYLAIGIASAWRTKQKSSTINSSIIFGAPLLTLLMQVSLYYQEVGRLAMICGLTGALYFSLFMWLRKRAGMVSLSNAFAIVSLTFFSLIFPLVTHSYSTAIIWSIEASAAIWLGLSQSRRSMVWVGIVLHGFAYLCILSNILAWHFPLGNWMEDFVAASSLQAYMVASAVAAMTSVVSAFLLRRKAQTLANCFFIIGLLMWVRVAVLLHGLYFSEATLSGFSLVYAAVTALGLMGINLRARYPLLGMSTVLLLPLLVVTGFHYAVSDFRWTMHAACWLLALATWWFVLNRLEMQKQFARYITVMHRLSVVLSLLFPLRWFFMLLPVQQVVWWMPAATALISAYVGVIYILLQKQVWPVVNNQRVYASMLSGLMSLLCIIVLTANIVIPFLSPMTLSPWIDPVTVSSLLMMAMTFCWYRYFRHNVTASMNSIQILNAFILFTGLSIITMGLARIVHYYFGLPYTGAALLHASLFETPLSILWSLIGLLFMLLSTKKKKRETWYVGAGLMALVVFKLFFIDMQNSETVLRILAFMGVGVVMLVVAYFSPLPPKEA